MRLATKGKRQTPLPTALGEQGSQCQEDKAREHTDNQTFMTDRGQMTSLGSLITLG